MRYLPRWWLLDPVQGGYCGLLLGSQLAPKLVSIASLFLIANVGTHFHGDNGTLQSHLLNEASEQRMCVEFFFNNRVIRISC